MKRILVLSICVAASCSLLQAKVADTLVNLSVTAEKLPLTVIPGKNETEKKTRKDQVANLLKGSAVVSLSVEDFINNLGKTKDSANLLYKRALCIGNNSEACKALGCLNEPACIQKTLVAINQFLTPLLRDLIGEKLPNGNVKAGALMSLLVLLPKDSPRRQDVAAKLASYVSLMADIMNTLDLIGLSINPASVFENTPETAKLTEDLKKSIQEETVVPVSEEHLTLPEGVDPALFN